MKTNQNNADAIANNLLSTIGRIFASIWRTTARFIKNIPNRCVNYVKRTINEYKRRPPRKDISKVYVLVGYTTKAHIDAKFNRERRFLILRKGLLILIFFLILFISINRITPYIDTDAYRTMFGVGSVDEMTNNDPFGTTPSADSSVTTATETSAEG